jgi:hypothetical protein
MNRKVSPWLNGVLQPDSISPEELLIRNREYYTDIPDKVLGWDRAQVNRIANILGIGPRAFCDAALSRQPVDSAVGDKLAKATGTPKDLWIISDTDSAHTKYYRASSVQAWRICRQALEAAWKHKDWNKFYETDLTAGPQTELKGDKSG